MNKCFLLKSPRSRDDFAPSCVAWGKIVIELLIQVLHRACYKSSVLHDFRDTVCHERQEQR